MEEWEYCLLWASSRKTVVVKPGGQVETFSKNRPGQGILADLQADGWQTVAFNMEPTVDMTYLFKRRIRAMAIPEKDLSLSGLPIYPQVGTFHQPVDATL